MRILATLGLVLALVVPVLAQEAPETAYPERSVTQHSVEIGGKTVQYSATAGLVHEPADTVGKFQGHFSCWQGAATKSYLDISRSSNAASAEKDEEFCGRISGFVH